MVTEYPPLVEAEVVDLMPSLDPMTGFLQDKVDHGMFVHGVTNLDGSIPIPDFSINPAATCSRNLPVSAISDNLNPRATNDTLETLGYWSQRYISPSCRQLIISVTRAFPRMMMYPESLPPFVHRIGCGLEHSGQEQFRQAIVGTTPLVFAPLRPIAACVNIAHMFVTRVPNSGDFLWQTIDAEQRRIRDGVSNTRSCVAHV